MKEIYWRPGMISRTIMILFSILAIGGLFAVEYFLLKTRQPFYTLKIKASKKAETAMNLVKKERKKKGTKFLKEFDPHLTGIIGYFMTPVTSNTGVLKAKQISTNPNFAGVIVQMLKKARVKEGDTIAIGLSGSFPALNIATYAAADILKLKVIVISSVSASQWGANDPDFLWIDMERELIEAKIFSYKTNYAILGGLEGNATGMSSKGKDLLKRAIKRNDIPILEFEGLSDGINKHIEIFRQLSSEPIKAYINVGGGAISVGTKVGKKIFKPGLNLKPPKGIKDVDSVMTRFINEGIPILHISNIKAIAQRYGLPLKIGPTPPRIGEGKVFYKEEYNLYLASLIFMIVLGGMYAIFRTELGIYIFHNSYSSSKKSSFEPTV